MADTIFWAPSDLSDTVSWSAFNVVLAPALAMLLGSSFALWLRVPDKIQACMQNFSAGLLISAVASELYPLMSPKSLTKFDSTIAITCGFVLGLIFMFGLEHLTEGDGDDEEEDEKEAPRDRHATGSDLSQPMLDDMESRVALGNFSATSNGLRDVVGKLKQSITKGDRDGIDSVVHAASLQVHKAQRQLFLTGPLTARELDRMTFHCGELEAQSAKFFGKNTLAEHRRALRDFNNILEHIHEHAERKRFCRWKPEPLPEQTSVFSESIPWTLVASVAADGGVDGLLIGLAFAASPGAGWAMSIATCIEMAFLGLSFCATITNATKSLVRRTAVVALPPFMLLVAGIAGTHVGEALRENQAVFVGFIGFSIVCLLFLVTQELLAEAREVGGDNALINGMLFVGLLGGILLEKLVG
eukprot:TRINITY_DN48768_c0_g1_i1.p1 TRINITY_DN48768_c0_g1~~TRINITY_DN48768_c0_g1_i1.p1  ORF type:complete len:415 (-),score=75.46 TRINITY_DN48768_c0_g1_i1:61-1305(-)